MVVAIFVAKTSLVFGVQHPAVATAHKQRVRDQGPVFVIGTHRVIPRSNRLGFNSPSGLRFEVPAHLSDRVLPYS